MDLELRALQAPPTQLWLWLGVFDDDVDDDAVTWSVDGRSTQPSVVRPMGRVSPSPGSRTCSGVYAFDVDPARTGDRAVTATVSRPGVEPRSVTRRTRPVPAAVPQRPGESFNLLLVSCYYRPHDRQVGAMVSRWLRGVDRPDLTLTVGDQVYLDNPPQEWIPADPDRMASRLEAKYRANWQAPDREGVVDGYAAILRSAPVAAVPDDHEYWNNYPHAASFKPGTWSWLGLSGIRDHWADAARRLFDGFQLARPGRYSHWFDVDPLSFFLMDNRTCRDTDDQNTMSEDDRELYAAWVEHVWVHDRIPVVVTGPSLLQPGKNWFFKRVVDRNIANYADYPALMAPLVDFVRRGRSVLALTGDVHYGRIVTAYATPGPAGRTRPGTLHEVIASPAALVGGSDGPPSGEPFDLDVGRGTRLRCTVRWPDPGLPTAERDRMAGDHVALLGFRRTPTGVELRTRYWMVDRLAAGDPPFEAEPIRLYLSEP